MTCACAGAMTEEKTMNQATMGENDPQVNGISKNERPKVISHNQPLVSYSKSDGNKITKVNKSPKKQNQSLKNLDNGNNEHLCSNRTSVEIRVENVDNAIKPAVTEKRIRVRQRRTSDVIDSIGLLNTEERKRSLSLSDTVGTPPSSPKTADQRRTLGFPTSPTTPASDTGYNSSQFSSPYSPDAPPPLQPTISLVPKKLQDTVDAAPMNQPNQDIVQDDPMGVAVKEAFMPVEKDADEYNMNHPRRGHAVIFNHDKFTTMPDRAGSDVDVENLYKTYSALGFQITIHHNKEYGEIREIISELAKMDHSDADCLLVTVLTHGMKHGLVLSSDVPYSVEYLWTPFTADNCLSLAGKPKIFIIQACRGEKLDPGVNLIRRKSRTETDSSAGSYKIPTYADFLIAYSSASGFFSWRNPELGTWFIKCLCQELLERGTTLDFLKILTRTARSVALDHESFNELMPWLHQQKQVPAINSMLIRDIYFRPKQ